MRATHIVVPAMLLAACGRPDGLGELPNKAPVAVIEVAEVASLNDPLIFDGSASLDPDGDPLAYAWDFGDGETSTEDVVLHTFTRVDFFLVTLTVTDPAGDSDTASVRIEVVDNDPPVIVLSTPTTADRDATVTLDASASYDLDGTIESFAWSFSDGSTDTGATLTKAFTTLGVHTVSLTVTDDVGANATEMRDITVIEPVMTVGYDGTWMWDLVNASDSSDPACGPFIASTLTITVSGTSITITEDGGFTQVVYGGTLSGADFSATADLTGGLGSQTISASFVMPERFEGTYHVESAFVGCDRTRDVFGQKM